MADKPVSHHSLRLVVTLGVTLLGLTLLSLFFNLRSADMAYRQLALGVARDFYSAVNAMRRWNLDHKGVYLAEAGDHAPNPYLPEALRTVMTADGRTLPMVNHAEMTRWLSELLTDDKGIHIHISSQKPLRPGNLADAWERRALERFEAGESEACEILGSGDRSEFRYMAPLRAQAICLSCHQNQSASSEKVRGGISVNFSYAPFLQSAARERRQILLAHVLLFGVGIVTLILMGTRLRRSVADLEESITRIKRLEGLLPVCASCRKIRLEGADHYQPESWVRIEKYIADRTDADFTHTICPDCARKLYPDLTPGPGNS